MKRNRQIFEEEEQETSARRGQRVRKVPSKLMEDMSNPSGSKSGELEMSKNTESLNTKQNKSEHVTVESKETTSLANTSHGHVQKKAETSSAQKMPVSSKYSSVQSVEQAENSKSNVLNKSVSETLKTLSSVTDMIDNNDSCPESADSLTASDYSNLLTSDLNNLGTDGKTDNISVSLDDCSEEQLDISETFITIETKGGLSSEKIPFSQFLKKVVVDKNSGNLKLDLGHLLTSCTAQGTSSETDQSELDRGEPDVSQSSLPSVSTSHMTASNIATYKPQQESQTDKGKNPISFEKPAPKRRGRPSKMKNISQTPKETKRNYASSTLQTEKPESISTVSVTNTDSVPGTGPQMLNNSPRRSRRTPAKNSRFGDDFVDSITLGKVASTSSTWNTQLMTLALAAERHKNKPQKVTLARAAVTNVEQKLTRDKDVQSESDTWDGKESEMEEDDSDTEYKDTGDESHLSTVGKRYISIQNVNTRCSSGEKSKSTAGGSLRGPKTLKKYEPVDPVVKRSLQEAFKHSTDSIANLLFPTVAVDETSDSQNTSLYYTIMEPKMEAKGHGLLIEKSQDEVSFKTVVFNGTIPNNSDLAKFSTSYPQDRYFSCDSCDKLFPSSNSWLQHNKYVHDRTINAFESSFNNTAGKTKYSCEFCGQNFPHKFMLDIHIKRKRHSEIKTFRCTLCKESFATHKAREEHWMMSHPARSCGLCGKQFINIVMLRRHINHNCHGARFRKSASTNEANAEDNMVVLHNNTVSGEKELIDSEATANGNDDVEETVKETDANDVEDGEDEDDEREVDSNQVEGEGGKVKCDLCSTEFSTYSGLWYHKLTSHQEFYPAGYKDKLKEKLEKNKSILLTAQEADFHKVPESNKNKFFVILKPKWPPHQSKLAISVEDKDFTFKPSEQKLNSNQDSLPHNSLADAPSKKKTSFECSQCGETFHFASNYREHRSRVHGECFEVLRLLGAFQCTLCSDTYPCQFMLDKHLKKHVGKKLLPCTLCGLDFHKIQERRMHWKTAHPGIGCPNCGKMYASIKYLQKHISLNCQDHFPPTKKFLEFQKKQHSDFEMSKSEKKVEKKIIQCHLCPKLCSSVHGWRRHMSEAHEDSGFSKLSNTCIICNELVYGYKALEKHLLENHAVESGLPVEEEDSMIEEALKKCEVDITAYRKAGRNSAEIYQDEEGNFHCPTCPKTHPDIRALRTHIRTHINMNLECSICHKTFKNPTLLKQHLQRHRKNAVYTCDICHKKFLTLQKLNKHRKVHHSTGNFVCELCGMSFALPDYLQKHKRCHTDKRPHCCNVCGKTFRSKPELRVHVLIHTRETPYKCQYCGRGFSQKGNYRIHLAQHTGEKPYKCDQCEISFALLCHLKRHKHTHDQKVNYRCIWCDKECTQRKHMQMHVQRVHKEDFFQYEEQMKLETPIPIAPSQVKLYNRRLGKMNKVRKQYRTRAQKCDSTLQQLMNGVVAKSEPMEEDPETSQNIVIDPIVEPMIETVSCDMAATSQDSGGLEILVSDDHQNYAKQGITADLLGQDPANVEIVMGENNEISIIIKDPTALQEVIGQSDLSQLTTGPVHVHESLQQAVEALVSQARTMADDDVQEPIGVNELEKTTIGSTDILSYDSAPPE